MLYPAEFAAMRGSMGSSSCSPGLSTMAALAMIVPQNAIDTAVWSSNLTTEALMKILVSAIYPEVDAWGSTASWGAAGEHLHENCRGGAPYSPAIRSLRK